MSDALRDARAMLAHLGESFKERAAFVIPGEPRSKARPRFGSGGRVYSSRRQRAHEKLLAWHWLQHIRKPIAGSVAVAAVFYRTNHNKVDVDNLLKQLFDAANRIAWQDDIQVTFSAASFRVDPERPRTEVVIGREIGGARDDRTEVSTCRECGESFEWMPRPSQAERQFCGRACAAASRGQSLTAPVLCAGCGSSFRRKTAAQKLCSEKCRLKALHEGARKRPPGVCRHCGRRTSRPEYQRCRSCFRKGLR